MHITPTAVLLILLTVGCAHAQEPALVTLENDSIRVVINPKIGRITDFGVKAGANLLRLNNRPDISNPKQSWPNFGGDWLWTAQQAQWPDFLGRGWPPDDATDGGEWKVLESSKTKVVIQSAVSPYQKVQLRREIGLNDMGLTVTNQLTQIEASEHAAQIWEITQLVHPKYMLMDNSGLPAGTARSFTELNQERLSDRFVTSIGNAIRYQPTYDGSRKIGTRGRWVAAVLENHVLVQTTAYDPAGDYPDDASMEVYADANYVEIETLGPSKKLKAGESMGNTVKWMLLPKATDDAQIVQRINALLSP